MIGLGVSLKRRMFLLLAAAANAIFQRNGDVVKQRNGDDVWQRGW